MISSIFKLAAGVTGAAVVISFSSWSLAGASQRGSTERPRLFASPQEAVQALTAATQSKDKAAVREIFGPSIDQMLTGDVSQDSRNFESFAQAVLRHCAPVAEGQQKVVLEIGQNNWPFPIPLVQQSGKWFFDTDAGTEEIICRHIGRDELHAIGLCRAYVDAQRKFASQHVGGRGSNVYATRFRPLSVVTNESPSAMPQVPLPLPPLTSLLETGSQERPHGGSSDLLTWHGYQFKILSRQGRAAPGGKSDYMVEGKMTRGFGLVAYPSRWGKSGVMTFIINQDGKLYQCNLGDQTSTRTSAMMEYNPTQEWTPVGDAGVFD
jgi:hypothetical protein